MLQRYDESKALPPNGLGNLGAICYFNSLLQGFMSCTAFNNLLTGSERNRNELTRTYADMIDQARAGADIGGYSGRVWHAFSNVLRARPRHPGTHTRPPTMGSSPGVQEDSSEAMLLFIECCDSKAVEQLFEYRYDTKILCTSCRQECKSDVRRLDEGAICTVHAADIAATPLARWILLHPVELDSGYRCPGCGASGPGTKRMYQVLTMMSEIFVVQFKKYDDRKWCADFPTELKIPARGGTSTTYRMVSQTEHSGGREGGHYWSRSLRAGGVYDLNDSSKSPSRFAPTANTYLVWYHA